MSGIQSSVCINSGLHSGYSEPLSWSEASHNVAHHQCPRNHLQTFPSIMWSSLWRMFRLQMQAASPCKSLHSVSHVFIKPDLLSFLWITFLHIVLQPFNEKLGLSVSDVNKGMFNSLLKASRRFWDNSKGVTILRMNALIRLALNKTVCFCLIILGNFCNRIFRTTSRTIEGSSRRGRPAKKWISVIEDLKRRNVTKDLATNREEWRRVAVKGLANCVPVDQYYVPVGLW